MQIPAYELNQLIGENTDEQNDETTVSLKWQEKRFSNTEIELYSNIENCKTDLKKKYNSIIKSKSMNTKNHREIFTCTNDDFNDHELCSMIDQFNVKNDRSINGDTIIMLIVVDLKIKKSVLFKISWSVDDGLLIIYPDFNDFEITPYYIEIDSDSRNMYSYGIKNTSLIDDELNLKLNNLLMSSHNECFETDYIFELPKSKFTENISILFEILTLENFKYNNYYVRYTILVPEGSELLSNEIEGTTHSSTPLDGKWLLGHCFDIMITNDINNKVKYIKIAFEIIAIDKRGIERIEGRCSTSLLIKPGIFGKQLNCMREINKNTLYDWFERFFIGGLFKFNMNAFNFYENHDDNLIRIANRYGNQTITTGKINIKYHIMKQSHPKSNLIMRKNIKFSGKLKSIDEVVNAYYKAKQRLEEGNF